MRQAHFTAEELTAYLHGAIRRDERGGLEEHLNGCAECYQELVALMRMIRPAGGVSDPRWAPPD